MRFRLPRSIQVSLYKKVLVAFLAIGLVPYFFIMLYFTYWGRSAIVERERQTHELQAAQAKTLIDNRLLQLERELDFLSKLELFDDMLSDDIDRRISRLLEQKRYGLQEEAISLLAVDRSGHIVAASQFNDLEHTFDFPRAQKSASGSVEAFIRGERLILSTPLKASFDGRHLGYLVARYPLENLNRYILRSAGVRYIIRSKDAVLTYGPKPGVPAEEAGMTVVSVTLGGVLEGYRLIYMISREEMFGFINRFLLYLTLLFGVGSFAIVWMGRRISTEIVAPVKALTGAAESIIRTGDYNLRVTSTARDETGSLAAMFNRLVETTGGALEALARENQLRMQRFVDLTDLFNAITRIDDADLCVDTALEQLSRLVPYRLQFLGASETPPSRSVAMPLVITDFEREEPLLFGHLVIGKEAFDDELEARFFESVAAMVALQIERIGLIDRTRSVSAAKTAFISNMSHELRTPLNAVVGYAQYLMAYEALSDEQIDTVAKIEKAAIHLRGMINDILDIAKIEAGKMEVVRTTLDPAVLLAECVEMITPLAEDKGLTLKVQVPEESVELFNDARLLKQVMINLLANAVKFTESGSIEAAIKWEAETFVLKIRDTGIGIAPEALKRVFDEFTQVHGTHLEDFKGTGLGLSLSRHIVQTLGGSLTLQSDGPGTGVTAIVRLNP